MPAPLKLTPYVKRFVNPVLRNFVGVGWFVELEHVGRRSGSRHRTPLWAFRDGDVITIALTYGPRVQWLRNVSAAGGARMHWRNRLLELGPPRDLTTAEGTSRMPTPIRTLFESTGACTDFVELPITAEQPFRTATSAG